MAFNTLTITDKGEALQAKVLGGATLTFTKAQSGSGTLPSGTDITAMTALIAAEQDIVIASVTLSVPNKLTARIDFTNDGLEAGYYWREIGLFADDPDDGEILYAYCNAGDEGTYMPAEGEGVTEQIVDLVTLISNVMSVTVEVNNSLAHPVWADLLINGAIPCTGTIAGTIISISNANITEYVDGLKIVLDMGTSINHVGAVININGMGAKAAVAQTAAGAIVSLEGGEAAGISVWQYKEAIDSFVLLSGPGNPAFAKAGHTHYISHVMGLQTALNGKQAIINLTAGRAVISDGNGGLTASSTTGTEVFRLSGVTSNVQDQLNGKAATSHSHAIANVTNLQSALDGKQVAGSYAASSHNHAAGDVTSGTLADARIPTLAISKISGLQSALDGKQVTGSYAAASHTHTITNVTSLQTALDGKLNAPASPTTYPRAYGTSNRTIDVQTAAVLSSSIGGTYSTTLTAVNAGASYSQADMVAVRNALSTLVVEHNRLRQDHLDTLQALNALLNDLQALGIVEIGAVG